ncbi:MAG: hypothetical protein JRI91_01605 [Deltaproteobacteria bacterium]|nr:hypothetical protein [Deltaproteobacteria bacterium]
MQKHPLIGLVMATMLEAKPFVTHIPLNKINQKPFPVFKNNNMVLIISGIGKANAAMAAFHCCKEFSPGIIVNAGAAGATDHSSPLGEFYHITKIIEYDRPDLRSGDPEIHSPRIMDDFQTATLATQDKAVIFSDKRKKISEVAELVDMEAASVVQACKKLNVPCAVFKYVTDTPAHTDDRDIVNHIRQFREPFYDFFINSVVPMF